MKKSKFTDEQIIPALKQADAGQGDQLDISKRTFYRRRAKFGGLDEARRLRELEAENTKLKRLVPRPVAGQRRRRTAVVAAKIMHEGPTSKRQSMKMRCKRYKAAFERRAIRLSGQPVMNQRPRCDADVFPAAGRAHRFTTWHLPQGAPTSPGLVNGCCYRLDCRLAGQARSAGAEYTRYADDLIFSGGREYAAHLERFLIQVDAIVISEGLGGEATQDAHHASERGQVVGGVVVHERARVPSRERDLLRAILTNRVRHGPRRQNWERVVASARTCSGGSGGLRGSVSATKNGCGGSSTAWIGSAKNKFRRSRCEPEAGNPSAQRCAPAATAAHGAAPPIARAVRATRSMATRRW